MNIFRRNRYVKLRLNSLCFRDLLRNKAAPVQHVEKVCVTTGVELIGPIDLDTPVVKELGKGPVDNGCPYLGFYIITYNRYALFAESGCPFFI